MSSYMQDGASGHCPKVVQIMLPNDLDGHMCRCCTCMFSTFGRGYDTILQSEAKFSSYLEAASIDWTFYISIIIRSTSVLEQCPAIADWYSKYHSVLYYDFDHLSKTMCSCQRKGTWHVHSLDGAPLPFHTRLVLPCIHLKFYPNPRTIWCYNNNRQGRRYQWKEGWKIQCKLDDNTCFARVLPFFVCSI